MMKKHARHVPEKLRRHAWTCIGLAGLAAFVAGMVIHMSWDGADGAPPAITEAPDATWTTGPAETLSTEPWQGHTPEGQAMLSADEQRAIEGFARDAITSWVSYDTLEGTEARTARLASFITSEQTAMKPVLSRPELEDSITELRSQVIVQEVVSVAMLAPAEGENVTATLRFAVTVAYIATWGSPYTPTTTLAGTNIWKIEVPLTHGHAGYTVGSRGEVVITEPAISYE